MITTVVRRLSPALLVAAIAVAAGPALAMARAGEAPPTQPPTKAAPETVQPGDMAVANSLSRAFRTVARAAEPSVVHINSLDRVPNIVGRDMFGRYIARGERIAPTGLGSGVIVSKEGYILTNNHVVAEAEKLTVRLSDGREVDASIVGRDEATDLAVVRIDAPGLTPAVLGDSDALEVGDWVVAVGNPFGFDNTVTAGIVSAKTRTLSMSDEKYEEFIQTDAAINPGNSGGPLFDLNGRVVGINSAIASKSGGSVGIGFAIPIDMARAVMETLIKKGRVERGFLGINMAPVAPTVVDGVPRRADGVTVSAVSPDTPAEKAGLKVGDVIVRYDGRPVDSTVRLRNAIALTTPGSQVPIDVLRDGSPATIKATIASRDEADTSVAVLPALGITVRTLTPEIGAQLGYADVSGVFIERMARNSPAAGRLQPGDVVVKVDNEPVANVVDFRRAMEKASGSTRLSIIRDGERGWVRLDK